MTKSNSPILWFQDSFCKNCKDQTCTKGSQTIYKNTVEKKIPCLLALMLMSSTDYHLVKDYKK